MKDRPHVTDAIVDHVEIYYPHDDRRHWVVHPGGVACPHTDP